MDKATVEYLAVAANTRGMTIGALLRQVLHLDASDILKKSCPQWSAEKLALAVRVDHEIRVRNPGVQYVDRKMFVGYRREGVFAAGVSERSQLFVCMLK